MIKCYCATISVELYYLTLLLRVAKFNYIIVPVSYTHLDVYKRQVAVSCSFNSSICQSQTSFNIAIVTPRLCSSSAVNQAGCL